MFLRPLVVKLWPSEANFSFLVFDSARYFGLSSPSAFKVLQNWILSVSHSQLACAARLINIPAVLGHANSASYFPARYFLISWGNYLTWRYMCHYIIVFYGWCYKHLLPPYRLIDFSSVSLIILGMSFESLSFSLNDFRAIVSPVQKFF